MSDCAGQKMIKLDKFQITYKAFTGLFFQKNSA